MIRKNDWETVLVRLNAEEHEDLGLPPTTEEMLAFDEGRLSAEETERVRRLLVAYPELARALAQPVPEDDESLPAGELDRQWMEFQQALSRRSNDAFSIIVPRHFLASPGTYQVVLYGVRGGGEERLATYSFGVPRA